MKQAIVTGGGGGIGAAIATAASAHGYRVGVMDVSIDAAQAVADGLENAVALEADVRDQGSVEEALDAFGETPDLLVNNAGIVQFYPLEDVPPQVFQDVIDINLVGSFVVGQAVAKRMLPKGTGVILNISSVAGIHPSPGVNAYGPTKAGLVALTELMAVEWGPRGIRCNAIAPGFINTGMSAPAFSDPAVRDLRSSGVPLRRLGTAEDVASTVMFLASDDASYITGQEIVVDGGVTHNVFSLLPREVPGS